MARVSIPTESAKRIGSYAKPFLRWAILGATVFFLASTLREHWQDVVDMRVDRRGWILLVTAWSVTLLAHTWCGLVWNWLLREFGQPASVSWSVRVFLKTNVAKYLPGNVWHFYGRIRAAQEIQTPLPIAILSVVLEPLLMAAAALLVALLGSQSQHWQLQMLSFVAVAVGVHPRILNFVVRKASAAKIKGLKLNEGTADGNGAESLPDAKISRYPIIPFLGELIFLVLRWGGFLFSLLAFHPIEIDQLWLLLGGFSFAWLLGLVVPGAPGGVGIFEATALAVLGGTFPAAALLSAVASYRLISVLAEAAGAGLAAIADLAIAKSPDTSSS